MNWQSTGYSQGDIMRMQEDAIRRVRQMQQRAQSYASAPNVQKQSQKPQQTPVKEVHTPVNTQSAQAMAQNGQAAPCQQNASPLFSLHLEM